jgi:sigma-54 dependent transcriptional regulator, acetoin dehydrogenase operon transcriptional activator AcoR
VRELETTIRHAVAMAGGAPLDAAHLPKAVAEAVTRRGRGEAARGAADASSPREAPRSVPPPASNSPSPEELRALLARHRGNVAAVARELGKDRAQIHRWLRYAAIDPADYR